MTTTARTGLHHQEKPSWAARQSVAPLLRFPNSDMHQLETCQVIPPPKLVYPTVRHSGIDLISDRRSAATMPARNDHVQECWVARRMGHGFLPTVPLADRLLLTHMRM